MKCPSAILFTACMCIAVPVERSAAAPVVETAPAADARRQLDEILAKPSYHRWERRFVKRDEAEARNVLDNRLLPESLADALRNFQEWLADKWFGRHEPSFGPSEKMSGGNFAVPGVLKFLFWGVLTAVVLLLGWLVLRVWREGRGGRGASAQPVGKEKVRAALAQGAALTLDGAAWLREADELADTGDFRLAWRALYLGLLSGLHGRGSIHFRKSRTNWTYVRDFRGVDGDRLSFVDLTGLFDEVWYGRHVPADASARMPLLRAEVARLIAPEAKEAADA